MATTRPLMARLAILVALLAQLHTALGAGSWTITEYRVVSVSEIVTYTYITSTATYGKTYTLDPTITPTAKPTSTTTISRTYTSAVVTVALYVDISDLASSELVTQDPYSYNTVYTSFVMSVTYTAPASCPTPFTVATYRDVYIPYEVRPYVKGYSTTTEITSSSYYSSSSTYVTVFMDSTAIPTPITTSSDFIYSFYVKSCSTPYASATARSGGGSSSGGSGSGSSWYDSELCYRRGACMSVKIWIIIVASIIPSIFVLGLIESYFWFRRLMLGKTALRLGTICWCFITVWTICFIRQSKNRSPEDQVLLKQYWATLGAGTRIKLWFKWGFRWKYPVEHLGNPDSAPIVVMLPPGTHPPPPGQPPMYINPGGTAPGGGDGAEKTAAQTMYAPVYPGPPGQQPYPGQGYYDPNAPQQGYGMPMPPQNVYMGQQQQHPGFVPTPPPPGGDAQQQGQVYPPYVPTPSPVQMTAPPPPPPSGPEGGVQGQGQQGQQQPPR